MDEFNDITAIMQESVRLYIHNLRDISTISPLSRNQSHSIILIGRLEPLTLNELAKRSDLEKSWISRVVDSMVKGGWLMKEVNPADRRSVLISLTPQGKALYAELTTSIDTYIKEVFRSIPDVTPEQTMAVMTGLLQALRETPPR